MSRGHRAVPRTADIALEAWADSREECLAEAVRALVETFADIGEAVPDGSVMIALAEETDEGLLGALLDEVVYQVEVPGRVAVDVSIDERTGVSRGQVEMRLATVPVGAVGHVGGSPTAVAVLGLRFGREAGMWHAHVVVDVYPRDRTFR
ncbi:archease [Microtetraspora sp. AC03309]|uniref:archease n=1 Tax=Microtetraspora sp. AC03309 TaxID=2779376 RepID=UPI001E516246|nr:archease [Microtetraspora sp. AC03309]MCC5576575.1 archease [Microtetraspora sp. AC03309]